MDHAAGCKPSAFTWAMGRLILQRMGDRETMRAITADPRMPAYCTVFRWVQVVPAFGEAYRELRMELAEIARAEAEERRRARKAARDAERVRAGKPVRHWVSGRRSSYTPELAHAVCLAIAEGASMSAVVATPGMPSFKVVYSWIRNRPDFRDAYIAACGERAMDLRIRADTAVDESTPFTLARDKALVAALEARMGRLAPKLYRPRIPADW